MQGGRLIALGHLAVVAGFELLKQVAGVVVAAVHQGGDIVGQLEGGELVGALADGGAHGVALIPGQVECGVGLRPGYPALILGDLNAGVLPKAKLLGVFPEGLDAGAPPHVVKEDVAGVLDGLGHVLHAVPARRDPAVGLGGRVVVKAVLAGALHPLAGGDGPGGQGRHGGEGLEGGAGGVQAHGGPVVQRVALVGRQLVVVLPEMGQVVGGVGGQGQHPAAHVHHRRRHALDGLRLPVLPNLPLLAGGILGHQVLGGGLEGDVHGEHRVVPRLRQLFPLLAGGVSVLVLFNEPGTADAVELLLKGQLHPFHPHGSVHGVAQLLVALPVIRRDIPGVAQHVGGVARLIPPGGGGLNAHTGQGVLLHL